MLFAFSPDWSLSDTIYDKKVLTLPLSRVSFAFDDRFKIALPTFSS